MDKIQKSMMGNKIKKEWKDDWNKDMRWQDKIGNKEESKKVDIKITLKMNNEIINSFINFNEGFFLKKIYNIKSFDEALEYINKNNTLPLKTLLRIIDCSWKIYGEEVIVVDNRLIDFYVEVVKKIWINEIYDHIEKYIKIDKLGRILLSKNDNNDNNSGGKNNMRMNTEKTNFIYERFINTEEMYKFLMRYLKISQGKLKKSSLIKDELIKYLNNKIHLTIY